MYPRFVLEILEISGKSGFLGLSVKESGTWGSIRIKEPPSSGIRDHNLGSEIKEPRFRE